MEWVFGLFIRLIFLSNSSISGIWDSIVPQTANRRVFEMTLTKSCECCNQEDRGTFGNILPQFRRKGRKYSLVEAIMASAYLARYELELKKKYPQERKSAKRWRKKNYNDIFNRKINTEMVFFSIGISENVKQQ